MLAKVDIDYSKVVKVVDVVSLKNSIHHSIVKIDKMNNSKSNSTCTWSRTGKNQDFHSTVIKKEKEHIPSNGMDGKGQATAFQADVATKRPVAFQELLNEFPTHFGGGAMLNDVSVHLGFICLLHVANEKGLTLISDRSSLGELDIITMG
uniref:Condensin complex subunit 2 n=1 Tax=Polytomella parva TaxID=51329 RepID=A0A7S0UMP5_9CHLO|mmetsp:Transcript_14953/g.26446  ORF Transcript_14953/g.26446 Transcript_14953/m.26446 type:complete len:150 (+) Transcript_14953:379-828(+)